MADKETAAYVVSKWAVMTNEVLLAFKDDFHFQDGLPGGVFPIDTGLVLAIIAVESGGDPNATGSSGEYGLMQILPSTWDLMHDDEHAGKAREPHRYHWGWNIYGDDPYDPRSNITTGVQVLWWELWYQGYMKETLDLDRAIRSYNVGYNMAKLGGGFEYLQKVRAYQNLIYDILGQVTV